MDRITVSDGKGGWLDLPAPHALLREARKSVDKHRRIIERSVTQAYRKQDPVAMDRYEKQLRRLTQLLKDIDACLTASACDSPNA